VPAILNSRAAADLFYYEPKLIAGLQTGVQQLTFLLCALPGGSTANSIQQNGVKSGETVICLVSDAAFSMMLLGGAGAAKGAASGRAVLAGGLAAEGGVVAARGGGCVVDVNSVGHPSLHLGPSRQTPRQNRSVA
jgi:hypothetical protein